MKDQNQEFVRQVADAKGWIIGSVAKIGGSQR